MAFTWNESYTVGSQAKTSQLVELDNNSSLYWNGINFATADRASIDYNKINWRVDWTESSGSIGIWDHIGDIAENVRLNSTDPFGLPNKLVWECRPDAVSGPDGGWNTLPFEVDSSKLYRYSVWIRRTVLGNGNYYFGAYGYGTTNGLYNKASGTLTTNPYFSSGAWPTTEIPIGTWALFVAYIWPSTAVPGANATDTGVYLQNGTKTSVAITDHIFHSSTTSANHRNYLYYSTDTSTRQQFIYPRVDLIDGTEPSITELLQGYDLYDRPEFINENFVYGTGNDPSIQTRVSNLKNVIAEMRNKLDSAWTLDYCRSYASNYSLTDCAIYYTAYDSSRYVTVNNPYASVTNCTSANSSYVNGNHGIVYSAKTA